MRRILEVIAVEASCDMGESITDASHASLDMCLHSSHAAASLIYSPAFTCRPGVKETEPDVTVPSGNWPR